MPVCPLCESTQFVGAVCEQCGKALGAVPERGVGASTGAIPDLEPTRAPPVRAQAVAPESELERGLCEVGRPSTPAPVAQVTCRYCHNVQDDGAICVRCGMRLPKLAFSKAAPSGMPAAKVRERIRCQACGSPAFPLEHCGECGAVVRAT